ncbi:hypothetical protein LIER_21610 [Lithospermum erythrorhizon]|uniref:Reverse transcriptase Ty1/copia-type domain-containing protein n=1 Tax=Lithospermum erythrorhizon TaxID=34254 RepID=A0AAV3QQU1_LITER
MQINQENTVDDHDHGDGNQGNADDQDNNSTSSSDNNDDHPNQANGNNQTDQANRNNQTVRQLPRRTHRNPVWMIDYVSGSEVSEDEVNLVQLEEEDPVQFETAVRSKKWRNAMDMEINSIVKNNTWTFTTLPQKGKKIGVKWIYKIKRDENGSIVKHKARLVAKGYAQKQGVDFTEVYAPVARMDTIRMIISIVAQRS